MVTDFENYTQNQSEIFAGVFSTEFISLEKMAIFDFFICFAQLDYLHPIQNSKKYYHQILH